MLNKAKELLFERNLRISGEASCPDHAEIADKKYGQHSTEVLFWNGKDQIVWLVTYQEEQFILIYDDGYIQYPVK
jgi:hypothetical protein